MNPTYRPDIDGLRAISILLVVLFHAFPKLLPGGYLGVDVFFVISGFLITDLVMRESAGREFTLASFYARRVRRLFPALIVVTATCLALGWLALLPEEYSLLGKHALAGSFFVPNFVYWLEAGYWDTASELKPLLHLWSLGVEEQFYVFWPAFVLLLLRFRRDLASWIAPLALLAFATSVFAGRSHAVAAFFLPQFRIWELMLGGLLALVLHGNYSGRETIRASESSGSALVQGAQSLAGIALILVAALLFAGRDEHSALRVLVPAIGTVLVIAAGMSNAVNRLLLANPLMVLVGKASYPFYLWHWPLLSFAAIVESGETTTAWRAGLLALSFVLALATYFFIERPVRSRSGARVVATLSVLYLLVGAVGGLIFLEKGFPSRMSAIAAQLEAFEWESKGLFERDDCSAKLKVPGRCLSNGKPQKIAVVGDSYSTNVFFILQDVHKNDDTGVMRLGMAGCLPFFDVEHFLGGASQHCDDAMNQNLGYVLEEPSITTVVFSLRESLYLTSASGNRLTLRGEPKLVRNADVFRAAMDRTLRRFAEAGKTVVFALSWPELDFDPKSCVDIRPLRLHRTTRSPCATDRAGFDERTSAYRKLVLEVLSAVADAQVWDPIPLLCDDRWCWAMKDGVVLYRDDHHLSLAGSEYLAQRYATRSLAAAAQ